MPAFVSTTVVITGRLRDFEYTAIVILNGSNCAIIGVEIVEGMFIIQ